MPSFPAVVKLSRNSDFVNDTDVSSCNLHVSKKIMKSQSKSSKFLSINFSNLELVGVSGLKRVRTRIKRQLQFLASPLFSVNSDSGCARVRRVRVLTSLHDYIIYSFYQNMNYLSLQPEKVGSTPFM